MCVAAWGGGGGGRGVGGGVDEVGRGGGRCEAGVLGLRQLCGLTEGPTQRRKLN